MSINDTLPNEASTAAESDVPSKMQELSCTACTSEFAAKTMTELPCSDIYCVDCVEKIFENALKDETMFPPSCCRVRIPMKLAQKHISKALLRRYKSKWLELNTRNRTYCWRTTCSTFIAPHSCHNGQGICQRCRAVTCTKCKSAWHFGACTEGDIDASFFAFVRSKKLKRCPGCKRIVEKNGGCNHIVCRCGSELCYGCGEKIDECICSGDEEDEESEVDDAYTGPFAG